MRTLERLCYNFFRPASPLTDDLQEAVNKAVEHKEFEVEYMTWNLRLQDEREEGREEGLTEGLERGRAEERAKYAEERARFADAQTDYERRIAELEAKLAAKEAAG